MRIGKTVACATLVWSLAASASVKAAGDDPQDLLHPLRVSESISVRVDRPKPLPLFYAGYAALQLGDVLSTTSGLQAGAREKNPLMQSVAGSTFKLSVVKIAATSLKMYCAESLWRQGHRKGAIVAMAVTTVLSGYVLMNNMRVRAQLAR